MLCIGHRGARGHAPENTLLSVRTALGLGARAIEIDVHLCEGIPVVIHDDSVDRTTNGHGLLSQYTLTRLRTLDAGQGERIPLLDEILDAVAGRACLNIELKGSGTAAVVAALLAKRYAGGWLPGHCLVSSFDWDLLYDFRACDATTPVGLLFEQLPDDLPAHTRALRSTAWNPQYRLVSTALLQQARDYGQRLYTFTPNRPADLARLHALGVDGVFCDYPERALPYQHDNDCRFA